VNFGVKGCWQNIESNAALVSKFAERSISGRGEFRNCGIGGWCYVDEVMFDLGDDTTQQIGPIPRYD